MVFTKYVPEEGKFGSGIIPADMHKLTKSLAKQFYDIVPDDAKKNMTYHLWYEQLPDNIKNTIQQIKQHQFWNGLCESNTCIFDNVSEMDELYYSKVPSQKKQNIMYGATGNYDLHVDGVMSFPGITFYRVLIGLTDGNDNVETRFPVLQESIYMNKDRYVVFDFDKAHHKVVKHNDKDNYRILLKLHFCVCEKCVKPSKYFYFIEKLYIWYEYFTRYIMQTGTNPETYYQFFLGLLAYLVNHAPFLTNSYLLLAIIVVLLFAFKQKYYAKVFLRILIDVTAIYLVLVLIFWLRYKIWKIR